MQLIITEKNDVAKKIAGILAKGSIKEGAYLKIPHYEFVDAAGTETAIVGLKGHVVQVDFPPEYSEWRKVEPKALIDAPLVKTETAKSVVRAVKRLAAEATTLIIATDFDREGELIGLEALNLAMEENAKLGRFVKRARFSALTAGEINRAFADLDELSEPLARAGEARQDIDLIWGATLTRFVSLATSRLGSHFLTVGRVQSPRWCSWPSARRSGAPSCPSPTGWSRSTSKPVDRPSRLCTKRNGSRTRKERRAFLRRSPPRARSRPSSRLRARCRKPTPFNTTSFTSAATSLGFSAAAAMRTAEDLYMAGHISYPRTDNTVYPTSLDLREALEVMAQGDFGAQIAQLLAQPALHPSRGDKRTTDHPPIYPTGNPRRGELGDREWRLYELVVRRFMATLSDDAVMESNRVDIALSGEPFVARGNRVVHAGWFEYYPYTRQKDASCPSSRRTT